MGASAGVGPTALVTGGTGFLGRHLSEALARSGLRVIATHFGTGGAEHHPGEVRSVDVRDPSAVRALVEEIRPSTIYHLAGQAYIQRSWEDPLETYATNLGGTLHVLEAARRVEPAPRVVFAGSGTEYGQPETIPTPEEAPLRPTSPYAASKAAADLACFQYHANYGLPIFRLRIFGTTGPGKRGDAANDFAEQLAKLRPGDHGVVRVGRLDRRRDLTDVRDAVRAMIVIAESGEPGTAYNVGSGHAVSVREVLDGLIRISGAHVSIIEEPARLRLVDEPVHLGDNRRLVGLGWSPRVSFDETLASLLDHWRSPAAD